MTTSPIDIDLGVIAESTPFLRMTATWDDGSSPGHLRQQFHSIEMDIDRQNTGSLASTAFNFMLEGNPWFQLLPNNTDPGLSENGGLFNTLMFLDTVNPALNFGVRQTGGTGILFAESTELVRMNWAGGTPGSNAFFLFGGTDRVHFRGPGAFVHESTFGRFEWERGGAGRIAHVGYIAASALGAINAFVNAGQTSGQEATPLGAFTVVPEVDAFLFGTHDTGNGSYTDHGALGGLGEVYAGAGSAAAPSHSFFGDRDTGFYLHDTGEIGVSAGGVLRAIWNDTGLQFGGGSSEHAMLATVSDTVPTLMARAGDNSGFCYIQGYLKTAATYTGGAVSPGGYLILYDATGAGFKVPAEAM